MASNNSSIRQRNTASSNVTKPTTAPASASSTVNESKSPISNTVSAFNISSHFHRLFAPRTIPNKSSTTAYSLNSLDGFRSILCIWMIAFHTLFYMNAFVPDNYHKYLSMNWTLRIVNLGYLPVDGFFILTGFLITLPLFESEKKQSTAAGYSFSLREFYFRRFSRMLPIYLLIVLIHCLIFPNNHYDNNLIRSESTQWFLHTADPTATGSNSQCNPIILLTNLFQLNHLVPFGGCMGWTWSFALQFQFYLFIPLLWKLLHYTSNRISNSKPSNQLIPLLVLAIIASIIMRFIRFFHTRSQSINSPTGIFIDFFWYTNTTTRLIPLVTGIIASYITVYKQQSIINPIKSNIVIQTIIFSLCIVICYIQYNWNSWYSYGNHIEPPGFTALQLSQKLHYPDYKGPTEFHLPITIDMIQALSQQLPYYYHHLLYHTLISVGSPGQTIVFITLLLSIIHRIGFIGKLLNRILSMKYWFFISVLSYIVYLIHPMIMTLIFRTITQYYPEWIPTIDIYYYCLISIYILSFSIALIIHLLIEQPLDIILRQSTNNSNRIISFISKLFNIYALLLIITSIIAHSVMFYSVLTINTNNEWNFIPPFRSSEDIMKDYWGITAVVNNSTTNAK